MSPPPNPNPNPNNYIKSKNKVNHLLYEVVSITSEIAVHDSPLKAAVWQVYDSIFSENQGKLAGGVRQSGRRYTTGNRLLLKPLCMWRYWKLLAVSMIRVKWDSLISDKVESILNYMEAWANEGESLAPLIPESNLSQINLFFRTAFSKGKLIYCMPFPLTLLDNFVLMGFYNRGRAEFPN